MMASGEQLVTTNYVLVETFALLQSRLGLTAVREFQEDVVPVLHVEFVTPETHRLGIAALSRLRERPQRGPSAMMRGQESIGVYVDSHFENTASRCILIENELHGVWGQANSY
jgi:hypothetical protein